MGSSFTRFRGHGFWTRDPLLEVWLRLLANEVDRTPNAPAWLIAARTHWHVQATTGLIGWIHANLDEILIDDERVRCVENICRNAPVRLRQSGPVLSRDYLNQLMQDATSGYWMPPEVGIFTRDGETWPFTRVGECFLALVRGELGTDAENSPMVGMDEDRPDADRGTL
jgi:hypothetical protein